MKEGWPTFVGVVGEVARGFSGGEFVSDAWAMLWIYHPVHNDVLTSKIANVVGK